MQHHILKCRAGFYSDIVATLKTFDARKNDRNYQVGDTIEFTEVTAGSKAILTGQRSGRFIITYLLPGGEFGIHPDYCILGIKPYQKIPVDYTR